MIEFYDEKGSCIASVKSSIIPPVDSMISIRKKVWRISRVAYALDHADEPQEKQLRANIELVGVES